MLSHTYTICISQSLSCSQWVVPTFKCAALTGRHTYLPWWSWGGCSGCFQMWRASTLHLLPAGGGGGNCLLRCTPAWGNTSCPEHTNRTQTWGWPSGTYHSCPAMPCTCTGELVERRKEAERVNICNRIWAVIKHYCKAIAVKDKIMVKGVNNSHSNGYLCLVGINLWLWHVKVYTNGMLVTQFPKSVWKWRSVVIFARVFEIIILLHDLL